MFNNRWVDHEIGTYTPENTLQLLTKGEILQFALRWMELEGLMLSEISQSEKNTN